MSTSPKPHAQENTLRFVMDYLTWVIGARSSRRPCDPLTPFSCFPKLTGRTEIRACVDEPGSRSCLPETHNPGRTKKTTKSVLQVIHLSRNKTSLTYKALLLSTGNSHPLPDILNGLFCCCKCHLGCHKATKRSCAEEKQPSGRREIHKRKIR